MIAGNNFCITLGILIANVVCYSTKNRNDSGSYRIPIAVQFLWAIILGTGLFFLPESPRYFVKKGKISQAAKALSSARGQEVDSTYIQDELAEIIANHEYEHQLIPQTSYLGSWAACFSGSLMRNNSNSRRTLVGILMQMMQQLTGINFIFYFGVVFFQNLGTISNPFLIQLITSLVNSCSTPVAFYTIERFGRRKILLVGGSCMAASQLLVGIIGVTAGSNGDASAVSCMVAFICINISIFAMTWGPAAWVLVGEIFPLPIRSRGVGLSTASNWFWNCVSCGHDSICSRKTVADFTPADYRNDNTLPCRQWQRRCQPWRQSILPLGLIVLSHRRVHLFLGT